MSFYAKDSTITFCWVIRPTDTPLVKADFDIKLTLPDGTVTYTNDGALTYTAPTGTVQGEVTYDLTLSVVGRYRVELTVGTDSVYVLECLREVYSVIPPPHVLSGVDPKTTQGPEIIPPIPVTPPDLDGYANIAYALTTRDTDYVGGVTVVLKAGAAAQAVPADWIGYTHLATIADALDEADTNGDFLDFGIHFPELPDIPKYGAPTIFDRSQNMTIEGTGPDEVAFDPLDEYNGIQNADRAWGCFLYLWNHGGATPTIAVFGGEAGYHAVDNGDNPEWEGEQWVINDDIYIKLSTD